MVQEAPRKGTIEQNDNNLSQTFADYRRQKIPRIKTVKTFVASKIVETSSKKGCLVREYLDCSVVKNFMIFVLSSIKIRLF